MRRKNPTVRREHRGPNSARGIAAVEFVVAVPLLIFLTLVLVEVGRALVQYNALTYSVRHGARYVSEHSIEGTSGTVNITPAVVAEAQRLTAAAVQSNYGRVLPDFNASQVTVEQVGANNIRVTANYPYVGILRTALPAFGAGGGVFDTGLVDFNVAVTMRAIY